jgi:NADPH:quinone reductase
VGFPAGIPRMPLNLPLLKGAQIVGVFHGGFLSRHPDLYRQNVAELIELFRQGRLRPRVSAQYPLERAGEAIAALSGRAALGKLVVRVADPA